MSSEPEQKPHSLFCTVFTPTYNRAYILPRVYQSLLTQRDRDFEWLVIDDGSTDITESLISDWQTVAPFPIRYVRQDNAGKHVAMNRAVELATGELFFVVDSDDLCEEEAIAAVRCHWETIPEGQRQHFAGVCGLCCDLRGDLMGDKFPSSPWEASYGEMEASGIRGDKCHVFRTQVLAEFPFPEFEGEKFLAEGATWRRISRKYPIRHVNDVFMAKEYLPDGLCATILRRRMRSPQGARAYYCGMLCDELPPLLRLRTLVNYLRFSHHARVPLTQAVRECPCGPVACLLAPMTTILAWSDRLRIARSR